MFDLAIDNIRALATGLETLKRHCHHPRFAPNNDGRFEGRLQKPLARYF